MTTDDPLESTLKQAKRYMKDYPAVNYVDEIVRRLVDELEKCDAQNKALKQQLAEARGTDPLLIKRIKDNPRSDQRKVE